MSEPRTAPLGDRLSALSADTPTRDQILAQFLDYVSELGLTLYPAQEEALLELSAGKHVILDTPTGSGKSLVALALHFQALAEGQISFYTAPTKALVNEKFFALCEALGPERVGLLTGDASVNPDALVICCTAEILSNLALRQDDLGVGYVVMDEFHYYGDRERGVAWQIPLITLRDSVFLLMSATLGDTYEIAKRLEAFSQRAVATVHGSMRPVPLTFEYRETPLNETIEDLLKASEAPIYLVNFTQRDCAEQAQNLTSIQICSKEERQTIAHELEGSRFDTPYGKEFVRLIRHGIGVHHAGLLPKYRRIVERLSQKGLIKVISGTDTLGVGVNIPIRTVLFAQLYKYDGEKTALLSAREFRQISGRAGRKGFDDHGRVTAQAPEWMIENKRIAAKLEANPNLKNKLVKKRPPTGGVVWDRGRFERLRASPPEPLVAQFTVTHGMLIHLLQGAGDEPGGGYRRLLDLIQRSHTSDAEKKRLRRRAAMLFRTLLQTGIIERFYQPGWRGPQVRVREGLQHDFSLNHTLSLYLVETLRLLDRQSEHYALNVLSLVEAILENPKTILYRQVDRLKGELIARLKANGVEYEERMAELEKVEHPKPNADFIYETFNAFAALHPWVGGEDIHPKSIAREMIERCQSFNEYIQEYSLARSEGLLLRHLTQVYKTALQTVPPEYRTDEFEDMLAFLCGVVRRTDASLLEEWELLMNGPVELPGAPQSVQPMRPRSIIDDPRAFAARVRSELHVLLKSLSVRDYETALTILHQSEENSWTQAALEEAMNAYFAVHTAIDVTPRARLSHNTIVQEEAPRLWNARQKIIDPEGDEDWCLDCVVDLRKPRDETGPLIELREIRC
jgi:superfamily II RNA helicase